MDYLCRIHNEQILSINDKGQPQCRICQEQTKYVLQEYQGKKKSLLKKQEQETLEKLKQSKKRMLEVQENLQMKMASHIQILSNKREALLAFFSESERKIEYYQGQENDFMNYRNQGEIFSKNDSTFKQIEEELKNISSLEKEFEVILEKAKNDYIQSVSGFVQQLQNQANGQVQQESVLLMEEKYEYQDLDTFSNAQTKIDLMAFNRDNTIIAISESFEIKFLTINNDRLFKVENTIEEDDMEIIECIQFGNSNNDLYYGTDCGKIKIWEFQNEKWSKKQGITLINGNGIVDIKLDQDDSRLFIAGNNKIVYIWKKDHNNWIDGQIVLDHKEFSQMCSIAIDQSSNLLISCSFTKIKIWSINNVVINTEQVIDGLEPNKNNKIYFINDRMIFVTSTDKFYFYEKNEEQKFVLVSKDIMPKDKKYKLPICYNPDLKVMLVQSNDNEGEIVEVLKFNEGKFNYQSSIKGGYNKLEIANNAGYIMLAVKADVNTLQVMKLK